MASSTLKNKCGKSNGMQEKVYIIGVHGLDRKDRHSDHCSASVGKLRDADH